MKPQLARSASKTRGIRAPELGEPKKGEIQSSVMDYLDMTPTRPTQLAPVKVICVNCVNLKVAYYSFEGVNEPSFSLSCKMFRKVLASTYYCSLHPTTNICNI